jgi:hypothetical protein
MEIYPKFEEENLSEEFSAEMEFHQIGPWAALARVPRPHVDERLVLDKHGRRHADGQRQAPGQGGQPVVPGVKPEVDFVNQFRPQLTDKPSSGSNKGIKILPFVYI